MPPLTPLAEIEPNGGTPIASPDEIEDNKIFRNRQESSRVPAQGVLNHGNESSLRSGPYSKRSLAARTLDWTGCGSMLRKLPTWRGVLILNYHRIGEASDSDFDRNLWSATADDFAAQLAILRQSFDVIGPGELELALNDPRSRAVMITFDDGYRDNYTHAFAALQREGLTATFFVTTGFLDQRQIPWWDEIAWMVRNTSVPALTASDWMPETLTIDKTQEEAVIGRLLRVYKSLKGHQTSDYLDYLMDALQTGRCPDRLAGELWMTWDMLREMRAAGMTIGGHTVTHPVLSSISADEQDYEVGECRRRLVAELGEPIDAFSYPVGGGRSFNEITMNAVARHGYRWAFTYLGGYLQPGRFERYALRRTAIETDIDLPVFRAITTLPQFFA